MGMGATTHSYCTGIEQKSIRCIGGVLTRSCMLSPFIAMIALSGEGSLADQVPLLALRMGLVAHGDRAWLVGR